MNVATSRVVGQLAIATRRRPRYGAGAALSVFRRAACSKGEGVSAGDTGSVAGHGGDSWQEGEVINTKAVAAGPRSKLVTIPRRQLHNATATAGEAEEVSLLHPPTYFFYRGVFRHGAEGMSSTICVFHFEAIKESVFTRSLQPVIMSRNLSVMGGLRE